MRMVEKKHYRQQVLRLMRLGWLENQVTKDEKKELEYRQLLQQLIAQEHEVGLDRMKDLDFARLWNFDTLYAYKLADFDEQQQLAQEVNNEYLKGKSDPKLAMEYERTAREMLRRGLLLS